MSNVAKLSHIDGNASHLKAPIFLSHKYRGYLVIENFTLNFMNNNNNEYLKTRMDEELKSAYFNLLNSDLRIIFLELHERYKSIHFKNTQDTGQST